MRGTAATSTSRRYAESRTITPVTAGFRRINRATIAPSANDYRIHAIIVWASIVSYVDASTAYISAQPSGTAAASRWAA